MARPRALALAAVLIAAGGATGAESDATGPGGSVGRAVEVSVQARLMEVIGREGTELAPFATDGCSGGMSAAWDLAARLLPGFAEAHAEAPPWEGCCVTHDRAYHDAGGARTAEEGFAARLKADTELRLCVAATAQDRAPALEALYGVGEAAVRSAYGLVADAMFRSVRLGGLPCSGLPWRWGYGYPDCVPIGP